MVGLHLAAYFGLSDAIIALMTDDRKLLSKDSYGRTPLSWAAAYGHEAVVRLLLRNDKVDPGSHDSYSQTPLSLAAENGHEAVVKQLLQKTERDEFQ
jgi:ankyrin repeat protein